MERDPSDQGFGLISHVHHMVDFALCNGAGIQSKKNYYFAANDHEATPGTREQSIF